MCYNDVGYEYNYELYTEGGWGADSFELVFRGIATDVNMFFHCIDQGKNGRDDRW